MDNLPNWKLFERIKIAEQQNNLSHKIDYYTLQKKQIKSSQNIIILSADQFSEKFVNDSLAKLETDGGELRLPEGSCIFKEPLVIPTGVSVSGIADRTDLVFPFAKNAIIIQGSSEYQVNNVSLKNVRIFHEDQYTFCAAVLITHAAQILIENVIIISPLAVGFLLSDHVFAVTFLNCHVKYAGLVGFMLVRNVCETLIKDCSAEYCQQSGVFLTDLKLPEHIDALDFDAQLHHTDHVIGNFGPFAPEDPSPYRTDIINCFFRYNRKMGITTDGVGFLSVKNTVIAHNDCEGITIDNGSWGCSITSCHIYNNGWRGNQLEIELGIDFVKEMGLMDDGSSKAKLPGISIDNAAYTRIENNHIEANWGDGVKMVRASYANSIINNLIENNNRGVNDRFHYFGVLIGIAGRQHPEQEDFHSCNNQIIGNDILGSHYAGIHLMTGVRNNVLSRNHIVGATFQAIEDHVTLGNIVNPALAF